MTLTATDFAHQSPVPGTAAGNGPTLEQTYWGYVLREPEARGIVRVLGAAVSRFAGTLMLLIAIGLLILPHGADGTGIAEMRLGVMAVVTAIGLLLFFFGRQEPHPEFHVDTNHGEIRVGRRDWRGTVHVSARLRFLDVASVYLLRSKDRRQPTRLFLRLKGSDGAIEVASGDEEALEALRLRLNHDLIRDPRQPAAVVAPAPGGPIGIAA